MPLPVLDRRPTALFDELMAGGCQSIQPHHAIAVVTSRMTTTAVR